MSDLHGYLPVVEGQYDLMIIAGDVVPLEIQTNSYLSLMWLLQEFQEWCNTVDCERVVLVPGNHDFVFVNNNIKNIKQIGDKTFVLINSSLSFQGKRIFGCPYTTMNSWAFHREPYKTYKKMIPKGVDILVLHQPPLYSGLGVVEYGNGDIKELGSEKLTERIAEIQPQLVLCGHIHTGNHNEVRMNKTRMFNVSLLDEQYRVRFNPKCIIL